MSKTDEMLKNYGFHLYYGDDNVIHYRWYFNDGFQADLIFNLTNRVYNLYCGDDFEVFNEAIIVNTKLHLAITEKMKELGWIE